MAFGFDDLAVAGVGAIGNLISGDLNWNRQKKAMREQMAWQEKMNMQQQAWQEAMWNKTNNYNDPSSQLERLKEAGINPNVMGQNAGTMGQAQMASQPDIPGAPGGFSPGYDLQLAQFGLLNAQKENIEADTKKKEEETEGQGLINERGEMENSVWMTNWNIDVALKKANIDLTNQQKDNLQFQFDILFPQEEEMNEKQIDLLTGSAIELQQKVINLKKEARLTEEKIQTEQAQQGVLAAQKDNIEAQKQNTQEVTRGLKMDNDVKSIIAELSKSTGVDITKLESIEQINLMLSQNGYSEEQIEAFWKNTRGDLSSQFQNALKKGFVDGRAAGAIGGAVVGAAGAKGLGKFTIVRKTNVNPTSGSADWMRDIQKMNDEISAARQKIRNSKK